MKKPIKLRRFIILLFSIFSYLSSLAWMIFDLVPQFIRQPFFKLGFQKYGRNCMIDYNCYVRYPWKVSVGDNVTINRGCELYASMQTEQGVIVLEDNAVLGPGVVIFAAGHDYSSLDLLDISAPVVVGKNAWVGGKTVILPGVTIGEGAVIGAGSVVSKDIPAYCIAVGNPAKVIKDRLLTI